MMGLSTQAPRRSRSAKKKCTENDRFWYSAPTTCERRRLLGRASEEALGKLLLLVKRRRVQRDSSYLLGCKVDVGLFA
jgi:hypothetical protein